MSEQAEAVRIASHAVVGYALGHRPHWVAIGDWLESDLTGMEGMAHVLASSMGQAYFLTGRTTETVDFRAQRLLRRVYRWPARLPRIEETELFVNGRQLAAQLLHSNWRNIRTVADVLVNRRCLNTSELPIILGPHLVRRSESTGDDDEWTVAVHEGGHVLAALTLGIHCPRASIVSNYRRNGFVEFWDDGVADKSLAIFYLAGPAAQCKLHPADRTYWYEASASDRRYVARLVDKHYGHFVRFPEDTEFYNQCMEAADRIVTKQWPAVERVAAGLINNKELTYGPLWRLWKGIGHEYLLKKSAA